MLLANVELLRDEINSKNMSPAIFEAIEQQQNLFSNDFRFKIKEAKNSAVSSKKKFELNHTWLKKEKIRLESLLETSQATSLNLKKDLEDLLEKDQQLSELKLDLAKKTTFYQSLEKLIEEKLLEADLDMLDSKNVLSRASPAVLPAEPNPVKILAVFLLLSFVVSVLLILFRQLSKKFIYTEEDLPFLRDGILSATVYSKSLFPFLPLGQ